jgi:hypothetical protein
MRRFFNRMKTVISENNPLRINSEISALKVKVADMQTQRLQAQLGLMGAESNHLTSPVEV